MMKKLSILVTMLVLVCAYTGSFAQDIEIHPALQIDTNLSQQALTLAKQQFTMVKEQLTALLTGLPPDQREAVKQAIAIVDAKLAKLDRIEVYLADESNPGEAFETLYNFYKQKMTLQDVGSEELQYAVAQAAPFGLIPQQTLNSLTPLLEQKKVKAAVGGKGKSRISLLTVYINPETFALIEKTTVVIAIDK
jgi:hypothetical protein